MQDYIVKSTTIDGKFRAMAINSTNLVREATDNHQTSRIASVVLGRALTSTLLMANSILKGEEQLAVRINGRGSIGNIVTEADAQGGVRGYVTNKEIDSVFDQQKALDIPAVVGTNGTIQVTKVAPFSEPYFSQTKIATGEIGTDFIYYLAQSEQIPTALGVSVYMDDNNQISAAGGFIIQTLPGTTEDDLQQIEKQLTDLPSIPSILLENKTPENILEKIFGTNQIQHLETQEIYLLTDGDKEYYAEALSSLPKEDIQMMIDEDKGAEVVSRFSNQKFYFSEEELIDILSNKEQ